MPKDGRAFGANPDGAATGRPTAADVRTALDLSRPGAGYETGAKAPLTKGTKQNCCFPAIPDHRSGCRCDPDVDGHDDGSPGHRFAAVQTVLFCYCRWLEPDREQSGPQLFLNAIKPQNVALIRRPVQRRPSRSHAATMKNPARASTSHSGNSPTCLTPVVR